MAGKVTRENLGGWLLKCNPKVYDVVAAHASGEDIGSWSVADNYRTHMMEPGDRVVLWMTGSEGADPQPGIWAVGHVTGAPEWAVGNADFDEDANFWIDVDKGVQAQLFAPISLEFLEPPAPRSSVRAHTALQSMEVFTQAQMSNPVFISVEEMQAIEHLVSSWPTYGGPVPTELVVGASGAAFGDSLTNLVVEMAAMGEVSAWYEARQWSVEDVSADKVGWDLTCRSLAGEVHKVEVKGVSGKLEKCLLTRNELKTAKADPAWRLGIVTQALSHAPRLRFVSAGDVLAKAQPFVFEYRAD